MSALTPKSNSFGVEWQSPTDANIGARCLVTGEPFHVVISLRRAVSTSDPDCQDLFLDHMDTMSRLPSPLLPCTPVQGSVFSKGDDVLPDLTTAAERLLKIAVGRLAYDFERCLKSEPHAADLLKRFMQHSGVGRAPVWKTLFGAFPPRGTLSRIARRCGATLASKYGMYNYPKKNISKMIFVLSRTGIWSARKKGVAILALSKVLHSLSMLIPIGLQ